MCLIRVFLITRRVRGGRMPHEGPRTAATEYDKEYMESTSLEQVGV